MEHNDFVKLLHEQVIPAVGCTEPVSIAIATAAANRQLTGEITNLMIRLSFNIFKNGMKVGIPGTDEKGIPFAAALALVMGNPDHQLQIFEHVKESDIAKAKELLQKKCIIIEPIHNGSDFYIEVKATTQTDEAVCIIESNHTNIISITKNGVRVDNKPTSLDSTIQKEREIESLEAIYAFIAASDSSDLHFLLQGAQMNMAVAQEGRKKSYSSALGQRLFSLMDTGLLSKDLPNMIKAYTASACDARMGGLSQNVMSSSGSGNQGIAAIVPLAVLAQEKDKSDKELSIALALSHLVTYYIKQKTGRLSPVCGCAIAAGIGSAAGLTYLQGGDSSHIDKAINNMIGSIAGMVCDGAKGGCSFKLANAVAEAYTQSLVVLDGTSVNAGDGIIGSSTEQSIKNLVNLCRIGMADVDDVLVDILSANC
ncbi:MAG: serine dehydratase subunit alpha family protein [Sphaerochaetaceae bacterium]